MKSKPLLHSVIPEPVKKSYFRLLQTRRIITHMLYSYGWLKSLRTGKCVDRNGNPIPWFSYPAIDFLSQLNIADKEVFEYGSGFSTLYWGARAKSVFTVESDLKWCEKIESLLPANCRLIRSTLDVEDYSGKISSFDKFDIIIIDGAIKTRTSCSEKAFKHLKPGGIIILDNSDQFPTSAKILRNSGLIQCDFTGFAPLNANAQTTSVFFSRDYNFQPLNEVQPHRSVAQPFTAYAAG